VNEPTIAADLSNLHARILIQEAAPVDDLRPATKFADMDLD
jgi:hypothetical protein